jgi:hypothetical protein
MKCGAIIVEILLSLILASCSHAQQVDFPVLKGPYLGQKPPGKTAQPFAVDVFSRYRGVHSNVLFSPEGNEAYWQSDIGDGSNYQGIFISKYENGIWTNPQVAPFSSLVKGGLDDAPFISPDSEKFFFLSGRPIKEGDPSGKYNIWMMKRTRDGWSRPQPLPQIVNSMTGMHWRLSVDRNGNLYFGTWKPQDDGNKVTGDIYRSPYKDGEYAIPEKLGPEVNVSVYNRSPFIAPDGSYLIFTGSEPPRLNILYICFKKNDGTWTKAKDLSNIIGRDGGCPIVTSDGKYLFFLDTLDGKPKPFWIEAGFINTLRKTELDIIFLKKK